MGLGRLAVTLGPRAALEPDRFHVAAYSQPRVVGRGVEAVAACFFPPTEEPDG